MAGCAIWQRSHAVLQNALNSVLKFAHQLWQDDLKCILVFKQLFYLQGFWPTLDTEEMAGFFLRYVNPRCLIAWALYLATISSPLSAYLTEGDELIDTLEPIALIFIAFMVTFYAGSLVFLGDRFKKLMAALEEMRQRGSLHAEQPEDILRRTRLLSLLTMAYFGMCVVNVVIFTFGMIPQMLAERRFYTSCWFPYDSGASPLYELTLVGWVVSVFSAACLMGLVHAFFMANLVQAIGQLQLLNHNLKVMHSPGERRGLPFTTINLKADHSAGKPTENPGGRAVFGRLFPGGDSNKLGAHLGYERFAGDKMAVQRHGRKLEKKTLSGFFQSSDVQMKIMIERCARHHQAILSYVGCINSAFNLILIQQYSCSFFPSLIAVILVTHSPTLSMKILLILVLVVICNVTLGVYCFLACEITQESDKARDSIFGCDWLSASENFKRSMRVMMCRCNQPAVVRVGGFITVSRESYWAVLKLIYTYYMAARTTLKRIRQ